MIILPLVARRGTQTFTALVSFVGGSSPFSSHLTTGNGTHRIVFRWEEYRKWWALAAPVVKARNGRDVKPGFREPRDYAMVKRFPLTCCCLGCKWSGMLPCLSGLFMHSLRFTVLHLWRGQQNDPGYMNACLLSPVTIWVPCSVLTRPCGRQGRAKGRD